MTYRSRLNHVILGLLQPRELRILFETYRSRDDLIRAFPEVLRGDLRGLLSWAVNYGLTVDQARPLLQPYAEQYRKRLLGLSKQTCVFDILRYRISKQYVTGMGVDIGPLHRPFIAVNRDCHMIRIDLYTKEKLVKLYPEIPPESIVNPDILCDGENLDAFRSESLNFIVASHALEHMRNPIGSIANWLGALKCGGHLIVIIPDKHFTFDRDRPVTAIPHLLADYRLDRASLVEADHVHYLEWATLVDKKMAEEVQRHASDLMGSGYSIHRHVFDKKSWDELLSALTEQLGLPMRIVESRLYEQAGELVTVVKKTT